MRTENEIALAKFAGNLPGVVMFYTVFPDGAERIEVLNDRADEIWGVSTADAATDAGKVWATIHRGDLLKVQNSVAESARNLTPWEAQWRSFDASGSQKWLYGRGTPEAMPDGAIRWSTFVFDITSQIEAETEAAKAVDSLAIAMEAIPDGFAIFDDKERLVTCNRTFRKLYRKSAGALVKGTSFERFLHKSLRAGQYALNGVSETEWTEKRLANFRSAQTLEEVQLFDGRWLRVLERPTGNGGRVAFSIDITRAKKRQSELENAALTDAMTGLLNRRGISQAVKHLEAQADNNAAVAFIHIDLDKFKAVNDALGHEAGDFVLTEAATRLQHSASEGCQIARVGGDEFVVALPDAPGEIEVYRVAERMRTAICAPVTFKGRLCQVGASAGVAIWRANSSYAIEQAQLDADTALIQGKALGRNRTILFREEMRRKALEVAHTANQIKVGLKRGQFEPYYQPQIEWPSGQLLGFETLARWMRHEGRATPASSFVAAAKESGLIVEIDREMISHSLNALHQLQAAGLTRATMSVNLSSASLRSPDLPERLRHAVQCRNISPTLVYIELVEADILDNRCDAIEDNVNALAQAGFRIALDDFGTGHTALASLRHFPVHRIKIDQSLVKAIDHDPALKAITEGIYGLCNRLEIQTVAEGVENDRQLELLSQIGVSVFQGYRIARPMALAELSDWLIKRGDIARNALSFDLPIARENK